MSRDIGTRLLDYLDRQEQALHAALEHWQPIVAHEGEFTDDMLTRIERLQLEHAQALGPLHAEYASLRKEWQAESPNAQQHATVRRRAQEIAALIERFQATEHELEGRVQRQMRTIAESTQEVRRGRKMTRGYGTTRGDESQYMDRQA